MLFVLNKIVGGGELGASLKHVLFLTFKKEYWNEASPITNFF